MHLVLAIDEKVLDTILLDPEKANERDYIESLCRLLFVKHELVILAYVKEPTFYIKVASDIDKINRKRKPKGDA